MQQIGFPDIFEEYVLNKFSTRRELTSLKYYNYLPPEYSASLLKLIQEEILATCSLEGIKNLSHYILNIDSDGQVTAAALLSEYSDNSSRIKLEFICSKIKNTGYGSFLLGLSLELARYLFKSDFVLEPLTSSVNFYMKHCEGGFDWVSFIPGWGESELGAFLPFDPLKVALRTNTNTDKQTIIINEPKYVYMDEDRCKTTDQNMAKYFFVKEKSSTSGYKGTFFRIYSPNKELTIARINKNSPSTLLLSDIKPTCESFYDATLGIRSNEPKPVCSPDFCI